MVLKSLVTLFCKLWRFKYIGIILLSTFSTAHTLAATRPPNFCLRLLSAHERIETGAQLQDLDGDIRGFIGNFQKTLKRSMPIRQIFEEVFFREYSAPMAVRKEKKTEWLRQKRFRDSISNSSIDQPIPDILKNSIKVVGEIEGHVIIRIEERRKTALSNIIETVFFNQNQMMVPLIYRQKSLVEDQLESTLKLMDRILEDNVEHVYYVGYDKVIWNSFLFRLNAIISNHDRLTDSYETKATTYISQELNNLRSPLFPSFGLTIAFGSLDKPRVGVDKFHATFEDPITMIGLYKNAEPDPLKILPSTIRPPQNLLVPFMRMVIGNFSPTSAIEVQLHSQQHESAYQGMGFSFTRNEPLDPRWPDHKLIKTWSTTREKFLEYTAHSVQ